MADPIVTPVSPVVTPVTPVVPVAPVVPETPAVKTYAELTTAADAAYDAYIADPTKPELKDAYDAVRKEAKLAADNEIKKYQSDVDKFKVPEQYDLKVPENSTIGAEQIERIAAYAKERGLTNDAAQAVLDREVQVQAETRDLVKKETEKQVAAMQDTWLSTAKNDKEFGGAEFERNCELAKRVLTRYATPEFSAVLSDPTKGSFGNHPELIRTMSRIGKAMSEDQLVIPGAQTVTQGKSIADKLYSEVSGSGVQQ